MNERVPGAAGDSRIRAWANRQTERGRAEQEKKKKGEERIGRCGAVDTTQMAGVAVKIAHLRTLTLRLSRLRQVPRWLSWGAT